jgi:type VI protein secretion system component VasF
MDSNLPATRAEAPAEVAPAVAAQPAPVVEHRRPVSVAFLPFALIVFLVLAFIVAGWTFFTAAY